LTITPPGSPNQFSAIFRIRNVLGWTSVGFAGAGLLGTLAFAFLHADQLNRPLLGALLLAFLGGFLGLIALLLASRLGALGCVLALGSLLTAILTASPIPPGNEVGVPGTIRTVISSEAAYANLNAGRYDTLECLHEPAKCLPAYPEKGPRFFLKSVFLTPVRHGYVFTFHEGPPAPGGPSRSAIESFVYTAVPVEVGRTGRRAYCGDSRGVICSTPDGQTPRIVDGECATSTPSCLTH
jgi:hypothetical protein